MLQTGRIDDSSGTNFYAFPSIALNKFGDALLAFSCFSPARFASACYAFRRSADPPGTFNDVATLKDGLATYFKTFSGTVNRWGDYSAAQVDPVNDVDLWTIQEYAASPANRWGTWWGVLALPPDITIDDVSLAEGNSGTTNARFTISLSFPSSQLVEVDWVAKDGTATLADSDFQAASGRASFPPGTTTVSVDVPVVGDLKLEPNETFTVDLSNPLFGVIADAPGPGHDPRRRHGTADVDRRRAHRRRQHWQLDREVHRHALESERCSGHGVLEHLGRQRQRGCRRLRRRLGQRELPAGQPVAAGGRDGERGHARRARRDLPRGPEVTRRERRSSRRAASARSSTTTRRRGRPCGRSASSPTAPRSR